MSQREKTEATPASEPLREEVFLKLYQGNEAARFEFMLHGGEVVTGHIAEADITPGDGPHRNRVYICQSWPYQGHVPTDAACRELRFIHIKTARRCD